MAQPGDPVKETHRIAVRGVLSVVHKIPHIIKGTPMTKIALITGASRGLGLETARRLARSDTKVIIGARDRAAGERAANVLKGEGLDAESITLDVNDASSVKVAAKQIDSDHGRLDILINNAGILPEASAADSGPLNLQLFKETFATNLFGAVSVIEEFLPLLRESDEGRIVNVSSTMGSLTDQSDPDSAYYGVVVPAYQTSKAALNGVTVALAKLLADTSIKVNSVCPGFVQTDLTPANREHAPLTAADASQVIVDMALIPKDGPTGQFLDSNGIIAW